MLNNCLIVPVENRDSKFLYSSTIFWLGLHSRCIPCGRDPGIDLVSLASFFSLETPSPREPAPPLLPFLRETPPSIPLSPPSASPSERGLSPRRALSPLLSIPPLSPSLLSPLLLSPSHPPTSTTHTHLKELPGESPSLLLSSRESPPLLPFSPERSPERFPEPLLPPHKKSPASLTERDALSAPPGEPVSPPFPPESSPLPSPLREPLPSSLRPALPERPLLSSARRSGDPLSPPRRPPPPPPPPRQNVFLSLPCELRAVRTYQRRSRDVPGLLKKNIDTRSMVTPSTTTLANSAFSSQVAFRDILVEGTVSLARSITQVSRSKMRTNFVTV